MWRKAYVAAFLAGAVLTPSVIAANGKGAAVMRPWRYPHYQTQCKLCSRLVTTVIQNNQAVSRDTIYKDADIHRPTISPDGKRIAFFRRYMNNGAEVKALSIINWDGTGLRDLVVTNYYDEGGVSAGIGGGKTECDWPAGNWIYYKGTPDDPEYTKIYRVDPDRNGSQELVVDYNDGGVNRLDMSFDGRRNLCELDQPLDNPGDYPHIFPPDHWDPSLGITSAKLTAPPSGRPSGCNYSTGASGHYFFYFTGKHDKTKGLFWNWETNAFGGYSLNPGASESGVYLTDVAQWMGVDWIGVLFQFNRGCNTSDKWYTLVASLNDGGDQNSGGTNAIAVNWKDKKALYLTYFPKPPSFSSGQGWICPAGSHDVWIDGGAANANKYEDIDGAWQAVAPMDALLRVEATQSDAQAKSYEYTVKMIPLPPDAQVYYTTDGSDPAKSSTAYSGQFTLKLAANQAVTIKARSFRGASISPLVEKKFMPVDGKNISSSSAGVNGWLYTEIAGSNLDALTSSPKFINNKPDSTFVGRAIRRMRGCDDVNRKDYVYRFEGYFFAPMSGQYSFFLNKSGNSAGAVWLSTSSAKENAVNIIPATTASSTTSSPVQLSAGNTYYIKALFKSWGGSEFGVGWTLPNGVKENPFVWYEYSPCYSGRNKLDLTTRRLIPLTVGPVAVDAPPGNPALRNKAREPGISAMYDLQGRRIAPAQLQQIHRGSELTKVMLVVNQSNGISRVTRAIGRLHDTHGR